MRSLFLFLRSAPSLSAARSFLLCFAFCNLLCELSVIKILLLTKPMSITNSPLRTMQKLSCSCSSSSKTNRARTCYACAQPINSKVIKCCSVGQPYCQWAGSGWKVDCSQPLFTHAKEKASEASAKHARVRGGVVCERSKSNLRLLRWNNNTRKYRAVNSLAGRVWPRLEGPKGSTKLSLCPLSLRPHPRLVNLFTD